MSLYAHIYAYVAIATMLFTAWQGTYRSDHPIAIFLVAFGFGVFWPIVVVAEIAMRWLEK